MEFILIGKWLLNINEFPGNFVQRHIVLEINLPGA